MASVRIADPSAQHITQPNADQQHQSRAPRQRPVGRGLVKLVAVQKRLRNVCEQPDQGRNRIAIDQTLSKVAMVTAAKLHQGNHPCHRPKPNLRPVCCPIDQKFPPWPVLIADSLDPLINLQIDL